MDLPNPPLLRRIGYALLIPALVLFGVRAMLQWMDGAELPGWSLAVVGILSGLAMLTLTLVNWQTPDRWRTVAAVTVALLGHYVVANFFDANLGGAMVYLGTGFLVSLHVRWASFSGMMAGVGALLRSSEAIATSSLFLMLGAFATAIAAALIVLRGVIVPERTP